MEQWFSAIRWQVAWVRDPWEKENEVIPEIAQHATWKEFLGHSKEGVNPKKQNRTQS